jgi:hypothetical protein
MSVGLYRTHEEYIELRRWEARLATLLESLGDRLEPAERKDAADYLAHAEYGLLIDSVAYWLGEFDRPVSEAERAEILAVAAGLGEEVRDRVARSLSDLGNDDAV